MGFRPVKILLQQYQIIFYGEWSNKSQVHYHYVSIMKSGSTQVWLLASGAKQYHWYRPKDDNALWLRRSGTTEVMYHRLSGMATRWYDGAHTYVLCSNGAWAPLPYTLVQQTQLGQTRIVSLCGLMMFRDDRNDWRKLLLGMRAIKRCAAAATQHDNKPFVWNTVLDGFHRSYPSPPVMNTHPHLLPHTYPHPFPIPAKWTVS